MELLQGRAKDAYVNLTMQLDKHEQTAQSDPTFTLQLADDHEVTLDLRYAMHVANEDDDGSFGSLLDRGLAKPFLDQAPGDHVKVRIHGLRIEPGTAIAVLGAIERRAAPGSGYRDAGEVRPVSVAVSFLAAGSDAAEQVSNAARDAKETAKREANVPKPKPKPKPKPSPSADDNRVSLRFPGVLAALGSGAIAVAVAVVISAGHFTGSAHGLALVGLQVTAVALFLAARRRFLPDLRKTGEDRSGKGKRTSFGKAYAVGLSLATLFTVAMASFLMEANMSGAASASRAGTTVVAAVALGLMLTLAVSRRSAVQRLRSVVKATPNLTSGRWCALDGVVVSGTYARIRTHRLEHSQYTDSEGKTQRHAWWEFSDAPHAQPMRIELATGDIVAVDTRGAVLAAAEPTEENNKLRENIRRGDWVRVVGRPTHEETGWSVASTGPDSLLILGSRRSPAIVAARRAFLWHWLALSGLGTIAIASVAVALG